MKTLNYSGFALILGILITSCSILRRDDPEKNVQIFLSKVEADLVKSDEEILTNFRVKQSREATLSLISILQNKDQFIVCEYSLANSKILIEKEKVLVTMPARFKVKELNSKDTVSVVLRIWLTPTENSYSITQINGEEVYQAFQKIKNSNQWEAEQKLALKERLWIYENAKTLEEKYDSVIWYATYNEQNYFYVVEGKWLNYFLNYNTRDDKRQYARMGLADSKGELIIPIEYDLIGTIGFGRSGLIEVTKNGKHGYFDIEKKALVVDPIYDAIIPYSREGVWVLVRNDSTYGWLDRKYNYTAGFKSKLMEEWYNNFDFLKNTVSLKYGNYIFCEIPTPEYVGNGIIIPPSYFSSNGIFDEIEGGITTTKVPVNAWTEYKETLGSFMEQATSSIRAVVTTIRERYLEGREEFYTSSKVVFIDEKQSQLGSTVISGQEVSMYPIDSSLLEVRSPHDYWFMEEGASDETNLMNYTYFSISNNHIITELKSKRLFTQTQFIRLDSSYLTGKFRLFSSDNETTFLSERTITYMRDEILASYGYKPLNADEYYFNYLLDKEATRYTNVEAFESSMSEIDKHNVAFLTKILELIKQSTPA